MEPVSTRIDDDTYQYITDTADERGVSRAEVVRDLIERGRDAERLERENQRLKNEKRTLIEDREERTDLRRYVEQQRDVERYRDRRQRKIDQAGALTRAKWWLTGVPMDDDDAGDVA